MSCSYRERVAAFTTVAIENISIIGIRPGSTIFDTYVIVEGQAVAEDLSTDLLDNFGTMLASDGYFSRFGNVLMQNISLYHTVVDHQPVTADQFQVLNAR